MKTRQRNTKNKEHHGFSYPLDFQLFLIVSHSGLCHLEPCTCKGRTLTSSIESLWSLIKMQNLKPHHRGTKSESILYKNSKLICKHIKYWETTLEPKLESCSCLINIYYIKLRFNKLLFAWRQHFVSLNQREAKNVFVFFR